MVKLVRDKSARSKPVRSRAQSITLLNAGGSVAKLGVRWPTTGPSHPPGTGSGLLEQLAAVVNLLAQEPDWLPSSSPEAGSGLLRRLAGKCLMHHVKDAAREHFFPVQLGVAVPAGIKVAVHTVRAWVDRHAGSGHNVLLKLDFENGFHCVKRDCCQGALCALFRC